MEARPPAENRHGGAPRGERVPLDARQTKYCACRRSARPSIGVGWKEESENPGAATRRGNEET